jgi:hypothetical protein
MPGGVAGAQPIMAAPYADYVIVFHGWLYVSVSLISLIFSPSATRDCLMQPKLLV